MVLAVRQNSPEWLEARRATIGSSDIPIIIGESTYKSAYTLAAEKLGLVSAAVDPDDQELMDIGHLMQPVLLGIYDRRYPERKVRAEHGWRTSKTLPWATASLDGTAQKKRAVEAKWANGKRWRQDERVPGDVQAQVQWQLFVVGWDVADVVVLDHQRPRIEEIERDDAFINDLIYFATEFYERLQRGELPPIDGSESTATTLRQRHPRDDGTWLPQTPELAGLVDKLAGARATKKAAEDEERTVANALRQIIADASGIAGLVSLKKNRDSERTNWPAVATGYRAALEEVVPLLDIDWMTGTAGSGAVSRATLPYLPTVPEFYGPGPDGLVSMHTDTVEGARVLRLLSKGSTE